MENDFELELQPFIDLDSKPCINSGGDGGTKKETHGFTALLRRPAPAINCSENYSAGS